MFEPVLFLDHVQVLLDKTLILQEVSLSVTAGEFIVILGPNGAGKTTFLKLILGLIQPAAGMVRVLGRPPRRGQAEIGYVPQQQGFDQNMPLCARDLVGFGVDGNHWGFGWPNRNRTEKIERALQEVGALDFANVPVGRLSGGEQQRLLLAQALISEPRLLLLDEPLANLDPAHQQEAVTLIDDVRKRHHTTVLLVSHDINPLLPVTDRVIYLAQGRSIVGTLEEVINGPTLSQLYGASVEVARVKGRYFVTGVEV